MEVNLLKAASTQKLVHTIHFLDKMQEHVDIL